MSRVLATVSVAAMTAVFSVFGQSVARAEPYNCPPNCDRIPATAWIDPAAIPLFDKYHWPKLADIASPVQGARFRFEEDCNSQPPPEDPRTYAVAARARVPMGLREWQLQVQVLHWRGETWRGGQIADGVVRSAATSLRACQVPGYPASPSITTDEPGKLAAVVNVQGYVPTILYEYLVADPQSSTVVELAMWSVVRPAEPWPPIPDEQLFEAMTAPLCVAYIASCR